MVHNKIIFVFGSVVRSRTYDTMDCTQDHLRLAHSLNNILHQLDFVQIDFA